jgi:serine protease
VDGTVTTLVSAGIPVVVAAGNSFDDACKYSPARAVTAVTVAAANLSPLQLANFSNYGSCVDVILPGVDVLSSINRAGAYGLSSGTSMATAHAAGVIASMLSASPCLSPASVASLLASSSSPLMTSLPSGTPNRLVNSTAAILAAAAHKC